jgi:large subunit ribosomal protein L16
MRIIPQKTKYRLKFRNKIQTKKIRKHDAHRIQGSRTAWQGKAGVDHIFQNGINFNSGWSTPASKLARYRTCSAISASGLSATLQAWVPAKFASMPLLPSLPPRPWAESKTKPCAGYDYGHSLLFGNYGIAFQSHGKLRSKFIETVRHDIAKMLKKKAKVWLRLCCDTPVTARPVETRMGKGKGAISYYEAKVRPGQIFLEFSGLSQSYAYEILAKVKKKSPLCLKLVNHDPKSKVRLTPIS